MHRTPFISKKYDALGRWIRKDIYDSGSLDSTIWYYYNDNRQALCEYEGTTRREFVYGNYLDEVWTTDDRAGTITVGDLNDAAGGHRHFAHNNTLYHVYGLTDEEGNLVEGYQYFGP